MIPTHSIHSKEKVIKMWFKRKKKEKEADDKTEEKQKEYISTDTPLGRLYNERLNDNYTPQMHSDALDYEMLMLVKKRVEISDRKLDILEERLNRLEGVTTKIKVYTDAKHRW